ncbi:MAG: PAS domain-containing protein, partial [Alphaproteobacteria bacterium]
MRELEQPLHDLARVFSRTPVGFCIFDADLRYCYINTALAQRNGLAAEAHLGRLIGELFPDLAANIEPALRQALKSGEAVVTSRVAGMTPGPAGETIYFRNTFSPILDDQGRSIGVSVPTHLRSTGFYLIECVARPVHFFDDVLCGGGPGERFGGLVVLGE